MPVVTLDEIVDRIRGGTAPKTLASELGITERAIRNRFEKAGRLSEYQNIVKSAQAESASRVDVSAIMSLADSGMSFNQACVELGYPRTTATRRLEDDGRMPEFYVRSYAARGGFTVPRVDASSYHEGPRRTFVSLIPKVSDEDADELRDAIRLMDAMVRDGATLSRICNGGEA